MGWTAYDVRVLLGILDLALESFSLESRMRGRGRRRPVRPARLYLEVLAFREMCNPSTRLTEEV